MDLTYRPVDMYAKSGHSLALLKVNSAFQLYIYILYKHAIKIRFKISKYKKWKYNSITVNRM